MSFADHFKAEIEGMATLCAPKSTASEPRETGLVTSHVGEPETKKVRIQEPPPSQIQDQSAKPEQTPADAQSKSTDQPEPYVPPPDAGQECRVQAYDETRTMFTYPEYIAHHLA